MAGGKRGPMKGSAGALRISLAHRGRERDLRYGFAVSSVAATAAGRKGGKAAHEKGTAHEWTSEEARAAGRKGGLARAKKSRKGS